MINIKHEKNINKKVLLRERKRHTARCVANTRYVVLTGYPPGGVPGPPRGGLGTPPPPRGGTRSGTPPGGVRVPPGGYPVRYTPWGGGPGTPPGGVPSQVPPRGVRVPPGGYLVRYTPPRGVRVPPRGGTRSGTPPGGYLDPPSPPVDRQTPVKTVPSRRTTYAGGNKKVLLRDRKTVRPRPSAIQSRMWRGVPLSCPGGGTSCSVWVVALPWPGGTPVLSGGSTLVLPGVPSPHQDLGQDFGQDH